MADASSSECFDWIAHAGAHNDSGPDDDFEGGSFVHVTTATTHRWSQAVAR